jgi:hypothetical protein
MTLGLGPSLWNEEMKKSFTLHSNVLRLEFILVCARAIIFYPLDKQLVAFSERLSQFH